MNKILNMVLGIVFVIVGIVVIFYLVGGLAPTLTTAATNISGSGLPLASLFSSNGVLMIIFMALLLVAVIVLIVKSIMHKGN